MTANEMILASSNGVPAASAEGATDAFEVSFETMRPAMLALTEAQMVGMTVGVSNSIMTVFARLHRIETLREEAAKIPQCDATCIDRLGDCTRALAYVHTSMVSPRSGASVDAVALGASGVATREKLFNDVTYLARYGLIDLGSFPTVKNLVGYRNVGFDLMTLVKIVRASWPVIGGKTLITLDEIAQAHALAVQLLEAAGEKEVGAPSNVVDMKQRAFSLFANTYDEVRRIVTFLRWHEGDADDFAPSLYAGRRGKKSDKVGKDEAPEETEGAEPGVKPVAGGMEAPVAGGKSEPVVPFGHPGGSPFIR